MATRTDPIGSLLVVGGRAGGGEDVRRGGTDVVVCRRAGVEGRAPFGDDELLEPADLALGALLAVLLEGQGVAVHPLAADLGGLADVGEPLLETRAPPLEDAQAYLRLGAREEGEADVEVLVVPGVRAARRDEVLEVLLAVGRQLVGDPGPLAAAREGLGGLVDPAHVDQVAQRRVEGTVGQRPEDAERGGEALAQLVAVQRTVVEQTQHRELEQRGAAALRAAIGLGHASTLHADISVRYITTSQWCWRRDGRRRFGREADRLRRAVGPASGEAPSSVPATKSSKDPRSTARPLVSGLAKVLLDPASAPIIVVTRCRTRWRNRKVARAARGM